MITTDINGNNLTSAYDDAIRADSRTTLATILMNGVELDCSIKRLEITKGSVSDTSEFSLGSIVSYTMTAEVLDLQDDVRNQILEVQIGLLTDEENDTWEFIKMGEFVVSEAKTTLYTTNITAHGRLVAYSGKLLDPYNRIVTDDGEIITTSQGELWAYPPIIESQSIAALGAKIALRLGCAVRFDSSIDTTLTINKPLTGMTIYQVIQIMAAVTGTYVTDTADGAIQFKRYSDTPTLECDTGQMLKLPDLEEEDFTIYGIKAVLSEAATDDNGNPIAAKGYIYGSPVNLTLTSAYITEQLFDEMVYLIGYSYRPGTIDLSLGDPRLEGDDVLKVEGIDGEFYTVPCHQIKHVYDGGFLTTVEAVRATNIENSIGTQTPFQRLQKETRSNFVAVNASVENVKRISGNTAQYFWTTEEGEDTGSHITEIPKEDFLDDPTNGGGNLLIRSNGLAVRDGLTELASFGADGAVIGQENQSHQETNYHAMKLIDSDGAEYLHFSDLRNADGTYTATDIFTGDGIQTDFRLSWTDITDSTVTLDGVATTDYDLVENGGYIWLTFTTAPTADTVIVIIYLTESSELKAYTLGTRSGSIGGYSVTSGLDNEASGKYSQAHGDHLKATGDRQTVLGTYNKADSEKAVIIGNGDENGRSNALTIDKDGHIYQSQAGMYTADLGSEAIAFINALTAVELSDGIGFMASAVDAADPWGHLVDDGNVDYISIIAALVKYCQKLEERITTLGG